MQANWSLVLNVIFLLVILVMMFSRLGAIFRKKTNSAVRPKIAETPVESHEGILGIREIQTAEVNFEPELAPLQIEDEGPALGIDFAEEPIKVPASKTLMLFIVAQGAGVFAGYELLQTLLTCGLRFGEGGLFHRHQHASGQGPILFSLAAATPSGMFDLQNMGAMTMKGLCIFMELSENPSIDQERFDLFIHTAKQLAQELEARLLDDKQQVFTPQTLAKMQNLINQEEAFA